MTDTNTKSWDHFCGSNFLKTTHVANEQDAFAVIGIEIIEGRDEENAKPRLTLEKNKETYLFDLNVTNANFCKNAGIKSPNDLVGKKMFFKKINVVSPKTKKEVESLRILKIE
jgi:hypothetical protein